MKKLLTLFALLCLFVLLITACRQPQRWSDEPSERAWWIKGLGPSFAALDSAPYPGTLLRGYDSLRPHSGPPTTYSRAFPHELMADYHLFITRDHAAAARSIDSALACFPTLKERSDYPRTYLGLLLFAGDMAYRLGNYDRANGIYFEAKRVSDELLPACERSAYRYNVAMVLYRQKNFARSATYFQEAFAAQATCPAQTGALHLQQQEILSNTGLCYLKLGQNDSALAWFDRAGRYAEHYKDSLGPVSMDKIRGVLLGNKAKAYLQKGRPTEAEPLLREAIALNARPGYELTYAQEVQLDLAGLLGRQQRAVEQRAQLAALRQGLDTLPNAPVEMGWYALMTENAHREGNAPEELRLYKRYDHLRDSLGAVDQKLQNADIMQQLRERELQLKVATLEQKDRRDSVFLLLLSVAIVLAALVTWLTLRIYRRNKSNLEDVKALNRRIRQQQSILKKESVRRQQQVMEAVLRTQEAERAAIGLELHDNINQVLTTVKLHNEMVIDGIGEPQVVLRRATAYLQQCINEIRALSKRLSAPTLGKISLCESVAELAESINLTGKLTIRVDCSGLTPATISQDVHLAAYRIIQEGLNNIIKHAGATEATIVLRAEPGTALHLFLSDNGSGLVSESGGSGITNMRTRAESLGGSFRISGSAGSGSTVEATIPVATKAADRQPAKTFA